jgi:integrase
VRRVPVPSILRPYLAAHRLACEWAEGFVFGRTAERPLRVATAHERARRAWAKAGLPPIGLHECRHTGITLYLQAGADWVTLAKIAGHADPTITMGIYGHLLPDSERRAAKRLDSFLGEQAAEG